MTNRTTIRGLAVIVLVAIIGGGSAIRAEDTATVKLTVGRSTVVNTEKPIARVSLTSADIADALVTEPTQLLIQGKVPGTISMFVWDRGGAMRRYDVTVERDLAALSQQMRDLFPGESISVVPNGKAVVVSGTVTSKRVADKAVEIAAGHVEKKEDVVNLIQVREGPPPQVLLRVRFAEVSRSALTELGASFFTGPNGSHDWVGRVTTQQFPAPAFESSNGQNKLVFSDFLNLFLFDLKNDLGAVIKLLQTRGLFQSLAEPNLVAESGKEASFLAGGEFPVPIAQGGSAALSITVMFKEFGVRLNFTPTVIGSRVRLKVRPEVSTLDFTNAIVLQGFRIPALSTRRTETELELQDGQTFAIAGLLNNTATESLQKVPGIGDIPVLGYLFRSKAAQKNRTELVVMITPQILPSNSPGVTPNLPRLQEPYLAPLPGNKSFPPQGPAFTTPPPGGDAAPEPPATTPKAPAGAPTEQTPTPTAEESAAALRARIGKAPTLVKKQ
jgi:pilus assembly protein CpaC